MELHPGGLSLTDKTLRASRLKTGRILDVGCGSGNSLAFLAEKGFCVYGVDPDHSKAEQAKQAVNAAAVACCPAENLPFPRSFFDALLCECVLSLIDDKDAALHEMFRVLKPKGLLLWSDLCGTGSAPVPTVEEWELLLRSAGFNPMTTETAHDEFRSFMAMAAWEGLDASSCLPFGVSPRRTGYCWGIAEKREEVES